MSDEPTRTRSLPVDGSRAERERCDFLHLIIEAARPRAGGSRHALVGISEIRIGRGRRRSVTRDGRTLELRVPDEWMSSHHAELHRGVAHWTVADAGSKNGIRVDGVVQQRASLRDRSTLELGRTVFMLRSAAPRPGDLLDVALDGTAALPGLATLVPEYDIAIAELLQLARKRTAVLVRGPTGCGKELVARAIHQRSGRKGPFVPVNCGALPPALIESELFGHRKGAFSGATEDHIGLIASADGGTLFLDEIGDLPTACQAALLRTLEESEVRQVGSTVARSVDLRVVSATHQDLEAMITDGRFREDLLARLNGMTLQVPPLSARAEDLGIMIARLLDRVGADPAVELTDEAVGALLRHPWPRNVRELVKCIERAASLAAGPRIGLEHLPPELLSVRPREDLDDLSDDDRVRKETLLTLLAQHHGNISEVARVLGRVRPQVQRWLKRYGIDAESFRR